MTERQKETIKKAVKKALPNEPEAVRLYICEIVADTFQSLESPAEKRADYHTSAENLRFSIAVNLCDELPAILAEARKATANQ